MNLHCAIKYCKVHYFADDTNLMNFQDSIKTMNKQINHDLNYLSNWLNANKIVLNVSKSKLVMFGPPKKQLDHELKIKLNDKTLHHTDSVQYLKIHLDKYLTWKHQINNVVITVNKANDMLSEIRCRHKNFDDINLSCNF